MVLVLLISILCLSSVAITLMGKGEFFVLHFLSCWCLVTVRVMCLFLEVQWVGPHCMIVVFPGQTHLHITSTKQVSMIRKYHIHALQTNPLHIEDKPQNNNSHKTSGR